MKIRDIKSINALKAAIEQCTGYVWLESIYGDHYDMKSELSQYVGMAALLHDENEVLELFASQPEDRAILRGFLYELEKESQKSVA